MAKLFIRDETGIIEKYCQFVMKRYKEFKILEHLNFLYVWRLEEPEYDKEGRALEALIKKLPSRERDIYGNDVELRIYQDVWKEKTKEQKLQLCYHELLHVHIEVDENFTIMEDDDGRIKLRIVPHDIVFTGFKKEIEEFGMPPDLTYTINSLTGKRER